MLTRLRNSLLPNKATTFHKLRSTECALPLSQYNRVITIGSGVRIFPRQNVILCHSHTRDYGIRSHGLHFCDRDRIEMAAFAPAEFESAPLIHMSLKFALLDRSSGAVITWTVRVLLPWNAVSRPRASSALKEYNTTTVISKRLGVLLFVECTFKQIYSGLGSSQTKRHPV